jgi:hypothetical protein
MSGLNKRKKTPISIKLSENVFGDYIFRQEQKSLQTISIAGNASSKQKNIETEQNGVQHRYTDELLECLYETSYLLIGGV